MEPKVLRDQLGKVMVLDVGGSGGGEGSSGLDCEFLLYHGGERVEAMRGNSQCDLSAMPPTPHRPPAMEKVFFRCPIAL